MASERSVYDEDTSRALSLWVIINRAFDSLTRQAERDIKGRGFSYTEWSIMEFLYHKGPQPMARLGEKILITSGSVTYVIDKLEQKKLVERQPCKEDRRVIYAVLTESGQRIMAKEFPEHAETIRRLMSELTPDEQNIARKLLKRLGLSALKREVSSD